MKTGLIIGAAVAGAVLLYLANQPQKKLVQTKTLPPGATPDFDAGTIIDSAGKVIGRLLDFYKESSTAASSSSASSSGGSVQHLVAIGGDIFTDPTSGKVFHRVAELPDGTAWLDTETLDLVNKEGTTVGTFLDFYDL